MLFMRIGNMFLSASLAALACALFLTKADALGSGDGVAIQYYFAGATELGGNPNFDQAKEILNSAPAGHYQDFVLQRLAGIYWKALQFDPNSNAVPLLLPLLHDLLLSESVGSFGGRDTNRMDFVLAARLDAKSAAGWEQNLEMALHGKGEALMEKGFSGERWNRPGENSFWILRARDWTVVGRGEDLAPIRTEYLLSIKQDNRPAAVMKDSWLSASVDWPFLATWAPLPHSPLKLARTIVDVSASNGKMRATAYVTYPEAVPWESQPWRIPKGLVGSPLSSFTASQDLSPYLNSNEILSRLNSNPLASQLFCWALRGMPLQNYAAWTVTDATNVIQKLGAQAPALLNPILEARDHTQLSWMPKKNQLSWIHMQLAGATLEAAHDKSGDFLLASLFPDPEHNPPSDQLWTQIEGRDDLIYYDWELTSLRLLQWRLLTELLPVMAPSPLEAPASPKKPGQKPKPPVISRESQIALVVTENWLASLTLPPANTVTEVTRTSPTELTIVRNSQFLFTGLELVLVSHWLADAPVGPLDYNLLPRAKMTGPGVPRPH
jgi:hypothetical protein